MSTSPLMYFVEPEGKLVGWDIELHLAREPCSGFLNGVHEKSAVRHVCWEVCHRWCRTRGSLPARPQHQDGWASPLASFTSSPVETSRANIRHQPQETAYMTINQNYRKLKTHLLSCTSPVSRAQSLCVVSAQPIARHRPRAFPWSQKVRGDRAEYWSCCLGLVPLRKK